MIVVVVIKLLPALYSGLPIIPQIICIKLPAIPYKQIHDTFCSVAYRRAVAAIGLDIIQIGVDGEPIR